MDNLEKIRQHLQKLSELSAKLGKLASRFSGPEGEELKERLKKGAASVGIKGGVAFLGGVILGMASVYVIACIILLVNIALDRLWLSALIVVGGLLLIGGLTAGAALAAMRASANKLKKDLSTAAGGIVQDLKDTTDEMRATMEELQAVIKVEAEVRKSQMKDMANTAKSLAPVLIGAYLGYRIIKRARRKRAARKEQGIAK